MTNHTTTEPRNALGIAALALGLVGLLFGLVPLTGFIAVGLGLVAVIIGLSNRGRLRRGTATNRKTTWAGIIAGLGAIALGVWGMTVVFGAVEQLDEDLDQLDEDLQCLDEIDITDDDFDEQMDACES